MDQLSLLFKMAIDIVDLPIKMVILTMVMLVYQRVYQRVYYTGGDWNMNGWQDFPFILGME